MAAKAKPNTKAGKHNKVKKVMHEFKENELTIGKSNKKVKNREQAIAIALEESGQSKYKKPAKKVAAPKKKAAPKKAAPKKKVVAKKKTVAKKKVVAKKKAVAPKKTATKKAAPRKKTAAKRTVKRKTSKK